MHNFSSAKNSLLSIQHLTCLLYNFSAGKPYVQAGFMFWFGLDKCQVPTKTALSFPLLNWTGKRKYDERLEGRDKDRERSLTNYCHRQNRLNLQRKGN